MADSKVGVTSPIKMFFVYVALIIMACVMLVPFVWMISSSLKLEKDVFAFPIQWIPEDRSGATTR